ncbi:TPA: tape measure protein [Raoultella ornithinolytica]
MSDDVVDFKLVVNDKEFTASIKNAGDLLVSFGNKADKPAKKLASLDRSLTSIARVFNVVDSATKKAGDGLQDFAAGAELASVSVGNLRSNLTGLSRSLKSLSSAIDVSKDKINGLTSGLQKAQHELNDFSDWSDLAAKSAKRFAGDIDLASIAASSMNRRVTSATKGFGRWDASATKAASELKKVRDQMDGIINHQSLISRPLTVRTVSGTTGSSATRSSSSGSSGRGMFEGLRGNIFVLGEIGDAARTVKDMLFGWQKPIIETNALFERTTVMLQGMAKGPDPTKEAREGIDYIINRAKTAPFSIETITDGFVKLKSVGLDPAKGSMDALVNAVAQFGGNDELFKRTTIAIQQMAGKGVVSMEELRQQLGEAVPTAMQAMATGLGVTMAQLTKVVSKGAVAAKPAIDAMLTMFELQYGGAAERMMSTISGMVSYTKTNLMLMAKEFGEAGYNDAIKSALSQFNDLLESGRGTAYAKQFGESMGQLVTSLVDASKWLADNADKVKVFGEIIALYLGTRAIRSMTSGLVSGFGAIGDSVKTQGNVVKTTLSGLSASFQNYVGSLRSTVTPSINSLADSHVRLAERMRAVSAMRTMWAGIASAMASAGIGLAITGIISLLMYLVDWYRRAKNAAKEYHEAASKNPESVTDEQHQDAAAALEKQRRAAGFYKSFIDNYETRSQSDPAYASRFKDQYDEQLRLYKEATVKLTQAQDDYNKVSLAKSEESANDQLKSAQRSADSQIGEERRRINQILALKDKELKDIEAKDIPSDQKKTLTVSNNDERKKAVEDFYNFSIAKQQEVTESLQKQQDDIRDKLKKGGQEISDAQRTDWQNSLTALDGAIESSNSKIKGFQDLLRSVGSMFAGMIDLSGNVIEANSNKLLKSLESKSRQMNRQLEQSKARNGKLKGKDGRVIGPYEARARQEIEDLNEGADNKDKTSEVKKKEEEYISTGRALDQEEKETSSRKKYNAELKKTNAELEKQSRLTEKGLADGKVMAETVGGQGNALAEFDKKLAKTREELQAIIAKKGTKYVSDEDVKNAQDSLNILREKAAAYREELEKTTAQDLMNKFAPKAQSIIDSGVSTNTKRANYAQDIKDSEEGLRKLLEDRDLSKVQRDRIGEQYKSFLEVKNKAFISEFGTATQKLALEYGDMANQIENAWSDAFSGMTNTLTDFFVDGKAGFSDLARSILKDMSSIFVKTQITLPLMNMLGMGTGQTATQMSGGRGNIVTSALNQGVSLFSDTSSANTSVQNGDQSFGQSAKGTSNSVSKLGQTTQEANNGISSMVSSAWDYTKSLFDTNNATKSQTNAIKSSIFSMQGLASASTALMGVFAMMGASSSSKSGKWLGFLGTVASGLVGAYAGGGAGAASSTSGSSGAMTQGSGSNLTFNTPSMNYTPTPHAKGGVFGPDGVVPLNTYSKGGIASKPQLALFGEGRQKEAYVPLPDGRSIPVTMTGEMMNGGNNTIAPVNININVQSDGSSATSESDNSSWNRAAQRMKSIALETIAQEKRPGGSLNQNTNGNR